MEFAKKKDEVKKLEQEKITLTEKFYITFEFARNYGAQMREEKYRLPDAVTVWSICEMAWKSMERIIFGDASKPRFYKKGEYVTIQGKQAER